jgi:glucose-6-phosphate 1-dehydrogenase
VAAKEPGYALELGPVAMHFSYAQAFARPLPAAYETLIRDVLRGDATLFMRADQVAAAWALIDPVLAAWRETRPEFPDYPAGSGGPAAADALLAAEGRAWEYPREP